MELTTIAAGNCKDGDHVTPAGEAVVEIPAELLLEAVRALGG